MAYKRTLPYSLSLSSGLTLTSELDLLQSFDRILLGIPTMASATNVLVQVAATSGGTYRNLYHEPVNGSTTPAKVSISSAVSQAYVPLEILGSRYMKVELSTAMTATAVEFDVVGISL